MEKYLHPPVPNVSSFFEGGTGFCFALGGKPGVLTSCLLCASHKYSHEDEGKQCFCEGDASNHAVSTQADIMCV